MSKEPTLVIDEVWRDKTLRSAKAGVIRVDFRVRKAIQKGKPKGTSVGPK
jgi:hypothetical protein